MFAAAWPRLSASSPDAPSTQAQGTASTTGVAAAMRQAAWQVVQVGQPFGQAPAVLLSMAALPCMVAPPSTVGAALPGVGSQAAAELQGGATTSAPQLEQQLEQAKEPHAAELNLVTCDHQQLQVEADPASLPPAALPSVPPPPAPAAPAPAPVQPPGAAAWPSAATPQTVAPSTGYDTATLTPRTTSAAPPASVHFYDLDILWSAACQVPTLFIRGCDADGLPLTWVAMSADFPGWGELRRAAGASWAFIEPQEHPVRQGPAARHWLMLHPCKTEDLMSLMLQGALALSGSDGAAADSILAAAGTVADRAVVGCGSGVGAAEAGCTVPAAAATHSAGTQGQEGDCDGVPDIDDVTSMLCEPGDGMSGAGEEGHGVQGGWEAVEGVGVTGGQSNACTAPAVQPPVISLAGRDLLVYMVAWFSAVVAPCLGINLDPAAVKQVMQG